MFLSEGKKPSHLFDQIAINDTTFPQISIDLHTLCEARNYRIWLYNLMKNMLGQRILEIGSGIGNYTTFFLEHGSVWATDVENEYVAFLTQRFASCKNCRISHLKLDVWDMETRNMVRSFHPDTIVCMNVLEHVKQDADAVQRMVDCLDIGGHLIIIVPALSSLYSPLDKKYGHYRRYEKSDTYRLIKGSFNVEVVCRKYFNILGVVGWWFNHTLLRREQLSKSQVQFFDMIVPALSLIERLISLPFGLSLMICIRRIS